MHLCAGLDGWHHAARRNDHTGRRAEELCRESAWRPCDAPRRARAVAARLSHLRRDHWSVNPFRRGKYIHHRRKWRDESRGRRRRARSVVPEAASALRHNFPDHQSDYPVATDHCRRQPGPDVPAGRSVCLRHRLEFLFESPERAGPAFSTDSIQVRPGCVLVAVRDYSRMDHLKAVLQKTNTRKHDIVVMTIRGVSTAGTGEYGLNEQQLFTDYERELFTRVVTLAEKEGKPVQLLTVPGVNPFDAMVHTAARLKASRLVSGVSARMDSEELARRIGKAWETSPEPRHPFSLEIISPDRPSIFVNLGPHPPRLWPEDIDLVHELWLELSDDFGSKLHHRDIVGVALRRMNQELHSKEERTSVIGDVREELEHRQPKGQ